MRDDTLVSISAKKNPTYNKPPLPLPTTSKCLYWFRAINKTEHENHRNVLPKAGYMLMVRLFVLSWDIPKKGIYPLLGLYCSSFHIYPKWTCSELWTWFNQEQYVGLCQSTILRFVLTHHIRLHLRIEIWHNVFDLWISEVVCVCCNWTRPHGRAIYQKIWVLCYLQNGIFLMPCRYPGWQKLRISFPY